MYGLLRIFDGIQPYRLEMGTSGLAKHRICPDGSDTLYVPCSEPASARPHASLTPRSRAEHSYKYWGPRIAQALEQELQSAKRSCKSASSVIVNAASQEYWKAVEGHLSASTRVVTVQFPGPSV